MTKISDFGVGALLIDADAISFFVASKFKKKSIKVTEIVKIEEVEIVSSERLDEF